MQNKTNWGILGAGKIAGKFASDLALLPDANLYAVGSRNIQKAKAFAEKYQFKKAYGTYESLLDDKHLDAVYIATPHNFHCENTIAALDRGVAVLCEKPLAINAREVASMVEKAKEKQVFLMEALWTLFLPHIQKTEALIAAGAIGKVHSIKADFGFYAPFDPQSRIFNPLLGGGALLDIGIYPLLLAQRLLGVPTKIQATAILGETNVDEDIGIALTYNDDRIAHLHASVRCNTPTEAYIFGTKGYIHLPTKFHKPTTHISVFEYQTEKLTKYKMPTHAIGYMYEAKAVMEYLNEKQLESPIASLQFSINLMQTMDAIRKQIGLVYPMDGVFLQKKS